MNQSFGFFLGPEEKQNINWETTCTFPQKKKQTQSIKMSSIQNFLWNKTQMPNESFHNIFHY